MILDSKQPTLPLDLVRSILERLSFVDFHRARCVSSLWYSTSKLCNPTTPSLILFPNKQNNDYGSCKLCDPRDHNPYTVRDLGFDFATSYCYASSGSWLLMVNSITNIYLLNLFTRERIPLPSFESYVGFYRKAVLWVDEKTKDYLVVWNYDDSVMNYFHTYLAYHKSGDSTNRWKLFQPLISIDRVDDMVFKESKLYVLITGNIIVFDFSSRGDDDNDSPKERASFPTPDSYHRDEGYLNLAVTLSGEILIIANYVKPYSGICFFDVYKMDSKSSKWSIITSIGDEVLLLDLGITVAAKYGAMRNCIHFGNNQSHRIFGRSLSNDDNLICVYDIQTDKVLQWFRRLPVPFKDARWFLPTFGGKCLL